LNIIGIIQFTLPGVFRDHIGTAVNGNLWTFPAEFHSYIITAVLIIVGLLFNRAVFTSILAAVTLPLIAINLLYGYGEDTNGLEGNTTVYYFFVGVLFYLWREKIVYSPRLFVLVLVCCWALMMSNKTVFIYPALLTYITLFIGMSNLPQWKLLKSGDYSYGIYLYSYPITQAIIGSIPATRGNLFLLLPTAIVFTGIFAYLSWHLAEKRVLVLKRYLSPRSARITEDMHPALALTPHGDAELRNVTR
jgi:peptidoglycan/LPS O-acetylase OafA/YrhL